MTAGTQEDMVNTYDVVIRGGEIHDGSGRPGRVGDVAIRDGLIVRLDQVEGRGAEEIDATGCIVTPGFVDVHTHYDGQAMWENTLSPSSNHGVTTVVMGNCGVGFAPCRPDQHDMLVELMEGVEDVPEIVMTAGLPWNWETFPDYLDALDQRHLDIDVAAQLPHSAVRVYVMGKRGAGREAPTSDDLKEMRTITAQAIRSGAIGVSTSRNILHRTKAGEMAPSLFSEKDELLALAKGLRDAGAGVFQMIPQVTGNAAEEFALMRCIAETSGRPLAFSLLQMQTGDADAWRQSLALLADAVGDGVTMRAQVFPRPVGFLYGLDLSFHYFTLHPSYKAIAHLPLADRVAALRDPDVRARLIGELPSSSNEVELALCKQFKYAFPMGDPPNYTPDAVDQIARRAAELGLSVPEYALDLLVGDEGRAIFFLPGANYRDGNLDAARTMARDPNTVLGLGDGGAHYGMICDASYPTSYLQNWVRDAPVATAIPLPEAIRSLAWEPAFSVGLKDRGRLELGHRADVNVIDLKALRLHAPGIAHDLPAGGRRLRQRADGYVATLAGGAVTYRNGEHTGALPGRLVRGARSAP